MGFMQDGIGGNAGCKRAFMVGVAFQEIFINAIQRRTGDLGAAGVIEEDGRTVKGRELIAD